MLTAFYKTFRRLELSYKYVAFALALKSPAPGNSQAASSRKT